MIVGQKQDLCADDVRRLAAGQWPLLETLRVDVPFEHVHYLRHASWPKLRSLQVRRYSDFVVQNSVWVTSTPKVEHHLVYITYIDIL